MWEIRRWDIVKSEKSANGIYHIGPLLGSYTIASGKSLIGFQIKLSSEGDLDMGKLLLVAA